MFRVNSPAPCVVVEQHRNGTSSRRRTIVRQDYVQFVRACRGHGGRKKIGRLGGYMGRYTVLGYTMMLQILFDELMVPFRAGIFNKRSRRLLLDQFLSPPTLLSHRCCCLNAPCLRRNSVDYPIPFFKRHGEYPSRSTGRGTCLGAVGIFWSGKDDAPHFYEIIGGSSNRHPVCGCISWLWWDCLARRTGTDLSSSTPINV